MQEKKQLEKQLQAARTAGGNGTAKLTTARASVENPRARTRKFEQVAKAQKAEVDACEVEIESV